MTLGFVLAGCAGILPSGGGSGGAKITGTVTYLQRIALPADAVIKVQLADVSRADASAIVLGEQVIQAGGKQVPYAFEIFYDPAQIDPRYSYAVQARIQHNGKLMFINDTRYSVITHGAPTHVDMVLKAVGGSAPR